MSDTDYVAVALCVFTAAIFIYTLVYDDDLYDQSVTAFKILILSSVWPVWALYPLIKELSKHFKWRT